MIFNRMNLNFVLFDDSSHPEDVADVLVVVGESEEDRQHEEVAADDDVRFVTLCDGDDDVSLPLSFLLYRLICICC